LLLSLVIGLTTPMVGHAQTWTTTEIYNSPTTDPVNPSLLASDGNLYGLDADGLFRLQITPSYGSPAYNAGPTYYVLNSSPGMTQLCFEGSDGNLYGINGSSQLVKVTLAGVVTVFNSAKIVTNCPILANDGNYYGGSDSGGQYGYGCLYQISSTGAATIFYNFTNTFDGKGPELSLVQGSDGNLYGFSSKGWFRYSATTGISVYDDTITPIPLQAPVEGPDGNFYTVSSTSVYKVTSVGSTSAIYTPTFQEYYDGYKLQGLFAGGDGNLYPVESDIYTAACTSGNSIAIYPLSTSGGVGTGGAIIGYVNTAGEDDEADVQSLSLLPAGDGSYYGGDVDMLFYYDDSAGQCNESASSYIFHESATAPVSVPIQMELSATHALLGKPVTLTWKVNNAFSDTMKQCYGYGALTGKQPLSGTLTLTPATAGVYTTSIVCGGTETGTATVTVGNADLQITFQAHLFFDNMAAVYEGQMATINAQIFNTGTPLPTGSISFYAGAVLIGTVPLDSQSFASITASTAGIAPGTYSLTATYAGDANYGAVTSPAEAVVVLARSPSTTTVSPATQSLNIDSTVKLTATVTGTNTNYYYPTGTVTFTYGSTVLSTASLSGSGQVQTAKLSEATTGLPAGTYTVGVNYSGDTYNAPSSTTATVTLTQPKDSVAVTASPNPVLANTAFNLTATATGISKTPTGTVAFYAGTTALAGATLNGSGAATVTIPAGTLAAGTYQITADYLGDSNNPATNSPAITLTVQ
jgi:hypothetical protein